MNFIKAYASRGYQKENEEQNSDEFSESIVKCNALLCGLGGMGETIWFPPWGDRRLRWRRRPRGGAP